MLRAGSRKPHTYIKNCSTRIGDIVSTTMSKINHSDALAVKNVISLYCEALDIKDFTLLEKVFVQDVSADYPFNSDLQGVGAVANAIRNR